MEQEGRFQEVLEAVHRAEGAVLHAQAFNNPEKFQHAHNELMYAVQLVNEMKGTKVAGTEEQRVMLQRARELLNHLMETHDAIQ